MATRVYHYAEALSPSSANTTSTPADALTLTIPDADASSSTWAVFYTAMHNQSTNSTTESNARFYHSTASTVLSESRIEPHGTTAPLPWFPLSGCIPVTFGASPGDQTFKLQYFNETGTASVQMRDAVIFAIKLTANDSTVSAASSSSSSSSTWVTKCDWVAPATATYGVFFTATLRGTSTLRTPGFRILLADGSTSAYVTDTSVSFLLKDTDDYLSFAAYVRVSATAGDHIKSQFNSPSGASISCQDAYAVGFRVSDMEADYSAQDLTSRSVNNASYVQRDAASDLTFTPGSAVDHFVFGAACGYATTAAQRGIRSMFTSTEYSEATSTSSLSTDFSFLSFRMYTDMSPSSSVASWEIQGDGTHAVTSPSATMGAWQLEVGSVDATATPSTLDVAFAFPAPTIQVDRTATPDTLDVAFAFPAPTIQVGATPDPVALTFDFPAPTIIAQATATPDLLALIFDFPAVTVEVVNFFPGGTGRATGSIGPRLNTPGPSSQFTLESITPAPTATGEIG